MKKQYHILNGDVLKQQFPKTIPGDIIVARECLVDGNVKGKNLDELFASRAKFLSENYGGPEQKYYESVVPEFRKILAINDDSDINLWFEDDLFCQVNFWFVAHLLSKEIRKNTIHLIRPKAHTQYGFGGLDESELISIYNNRFVLTELEKIGSLWKWFQNDDSDKIISTAQELETAYPFILSAVEAHIERKPSNENLGRPIQSILTIMEELETEEFRPIFREFCKRESIYGFGDLQVKRLYNEIINNR